MPRIETERLTPQRALEISRDLWAWLAEEDGLVKADWPGWTAVGKMHLDCPLCEMREQIDMSCAVCPVEWNGRPNRAGGCYSCMMERSPFMKWLETRSAADAKQVLALIEESLVAIKKEREGTWT